MLAADKLQLQSALKQQATALKEKEFNLHHSNFMTVGTQAAVLAGLDITMFIEFNPPGETAWQTDHVWIYRSMRACYYAMIVAAFCANLAVVAQTTVLSVYGAGLALRGPDGSMMTATEGLYEERTRVFRTFAHGVVWTVTSLWICVWLLLPWEAASVCCCIAMGTSRAMYRNYQRVADRFAYNEADTVDFADIFNGPAAIRAVPATVHQVMFGNSNGTNGSNKDSNNSTTGQPMPRRNQSFLFRSSSTASSSDPTTARRSRRRNGTSNPSSEDNKEEEEDEELGLDDTNETDPLVEATTTKSSSAVKQRRTAAHSLL